MKIIIKVKPASSRNLVEKVDEHNFIVWVKERPADGKANAAIIKLLSEYFDMAPSLVEIVSGHMARTKVIELGE